MIKTERSMIKTERSMITRWTLLSRAMSTFGGNDLS